MSNRHFYYTFLLALIALNMNARGQNTQQTSTEQPAEFKPSGKVWGLVFGDYYVKTHADSLNRGNVQYSNIPKNYNAFAFRRIYLGYDYQISEKFAAQLLLAHESDNLDASGERTVYIKAANVRWKNIIHNNDLIIGQMATPVFALMSEPVWGYRSVEKTIADMRKIGSSNDLGIAWQGKLNDKGDYGYNLMIANGSAQKPETDKYKKFYGELYAKFLGQKIIVDVTGDYEPSSATQSKTTVKGFVAYQTDLFTAGIEVVNQMQKAASKDTTAGAANGKNVDVNLLGLSIFARGQIIKDKLNYFARYDNFNPDTKFDANVKYSTKVASDKENFITAGIDWMPVKNVHIMPNVWVDSFSSMKNNVSGKVKSDYDLTARLTFYYVFK
jgi:hypothetical protein